MANRLDLVIEDRVQIRGRQRRERQNTAREVVAEIVSEDRLEDVAKQGKPGLTMNVEVRFRQVEEMVLGRVSQAVDRLHGQNLFLRQELDGPVTQPLPQTRIKADSVLRTPFSDLPALVEDRGLQKHLKAVVEKNQDRVDSASVGRSVKQFDAENE